MGWAAPPHTRRQFRGVINKEQVIAITKGIGTLDSLFERDGTTLKDLSKGNKHKNFNIKRALIYFLTQNVKGKLVRRRLANSLPLSRLVSLFVFRFFRCLFRCDHFQDFR